MCQWSVYYNAYGFGTCHSASANTYDNTNTNANLLTGPRPSPHAPALVVSTATPTMAANAPRPTANSPRLTMPSPVSVPIPNTPPKLPSLLDDLPSVPLLAVNVPDKTNSKEDLDDLAVPFLGEDMGDELAALPEGVRLSPRASYIE
ncbi:hypothetical protein BDF22DRAFT_654320 [Syncephalis plumigaleata]|nr:hypothetical protein BDF22DRAFT_654320 [Syncephalis plumigaleata]